MAHSNPRRKGKRRLEPIATRETQVLRLAEYATSLPPAIGSDDDDGCELWFYLQGVYQQLSYEYEGFLSWLSCRVTFRKDGQLVISGECTGRRGDAAHAAHAGVGGQRKVYEVPWLGRISYL